MKPYVMIGLAGLFLVAMLFATGCIDDGKKEVIIVGVGEDFPPWSYPNEHGEYIGFAVEVITEIAQMHGKEVEIVPLHWTNIVDNVADGTVDVVIGGLTITPDRSEIVDFSMPYIYANRAVAVRTDSNITMDDVMAGKVTIATIANGTSDKWIRENIGDEFLAMQTVEAAFEELKNGRAEALIYEEAAINRYIRSGPYMKLDVIPIRAPHAVAVRKGDAETMNMVNEGITALRSSSAEWQRLHTKYNVPYT